MILPIQIELQPLDELLPYARNSRTHSEAQVAQIAASIHEFGWTNPILVGPDGVIIAGHARVLAARMLGMTEVPTIVLRHLSESQRRALVIADNQLGLSAGWDEAMLRDELQALGCEGFGLEVIGFSEAELGRLLDGPMVESAQVAAQEETLPAPPQRPVTRPGDLWEIGRHRLICGDCRDRSVVEVLFGGTVVNLAITSPPYATQREYDPASGFKPVPPDEYVEWFRTVAANVQAVLASDGSWFVNIKEHSEDGERSLYVKDLVLAHRRRWGWRFVDEFCWRNTANGVPGKWPNRLKNAWEPVFHFCVGKEIKFRPQAAGHRSDDVVVYSPCNPSAPSGSGLLGCGAEKVSGIAWPSNVIEAKAEGGQGAHSAPFPRALPEFFLKTFSDPGDVVFDPFMGSGTTIAAAHLLDRVAHGVEISPAYCDVIVRRLQALDPNLIVKLADDGCSFEEIATRRQVVAA